MEQIRYAYRREFTWLNVDLSQYDPLVRQNILAFCRELYGHTLFTRYSYKSGRRCWASAYSPPSLCVQFFTGGWLEWYALTTLLTLCMQHGQGVLLRARLGNRTAQNGESRELDVVALIGGRTLLVIECKSGEFRGEIEKYVKLRQRLGIDRTQFMICNPELTDEQATGLGAMYGLTFVNLSSLRTHLGAFM